MSANRQDGQGVSNNIPLSDVVISGGNRNIDNGQNANTKLLNNDRTTADGPDLSIPMQPDPMAEIPGAPPDFNLYRNKKTLTQGLMDIALFSANANQLRFVLENGNSTVASYYISASLIIISLVLQIGVGLLLLLSTRYNVTVECQREICYKYGNYVTIGIFLITAVNVIIIAFVDISIAVGLLLLIGTQYSVTVEGQRNAANRCQNYIVGGIFLITVLNVFLAAFGGPGILGPTGSTTRI